jgi:hypothetical protein
MSDTSSSSSNASTDSDTFNQSELLDIIAILLLPKDAKVDLEVKKCAFMTKKIKGSHFRITLCITMLWSLQIKSNESFMRLWNNFLCKTILVELFLGYVFPFT